MTLGPAAADVAALTEITPSELLKRRPYDHWRGWESRVQLALEVHTKYMDLTRRYEDAVESIWEGQYSEAADMPMLNLVFPHLKVKIPQLFFRTPRFHVKPLSPIFEVPVRGADGELVQEPRDNEQSARTAEGVLNHWVKTSKFKKELKRVIQDALLRFGIVKCGYHSEFAYDDKMSSEDDEQRDSVEWDLKVARRFMYAKRVSPTNFVMDPFAKSFEACSWVAERITKPLSAILQDPLYRRVRKNGKSLLAHFRGMGTKSREQASGTRSNVGVVPKGTAGSQLDAGLLFSEQIPGIRRNRSMAGELGSFTHPSHPESGDPMITLWEIHDLRNQRIKVISPSFPELFLRDTEHPFPGMNLYKILYFHEIPDKLYPMSDIHPWWQQQREINRVKQYKQEHYRRFLAKNWYLKGHVDPRELQKALDPKMGGWVQVKSSQAIGEIKAQDLPGGVLEQENSTMQDYRITSGITAQQQTVSEGQRTATETVSLQQTSEIRLIEQKDIVTGFFTEIGECVLHIYKTMGPDDYENIPLGGDLGEGSYQMWNKSSIQGLHKVDVTISEMDFSNPDVKKKNALEAFQLMGQHPDVVNVAKLILWLMEAMGHPDPRSLLLVPDPNKTLQDVVQRLVDEQMQPMLEQLGMTGGGGAGAPAGGGGSPSRGKPSSGSPLSLAGPKGAENKLRMSNPGSFKAGYGARPSARTPVRGGGVGSR